MLTHKKCALKKRPTLDFFLSFSLSVLCVCVCEPFFASSNFASRMKTHDCNKSTGGHDGSRLSACSFSLSLSFSLVDDLKALSVSGIILRALASYVFSRACSSKVASKALAIVSQCTFFYFVRSIVCFLACFLLPSAPFQLAARCLLRAHTHTQNNKLPIS